MRGHGYLRIASVLAVLTAFSRTLAAAGPPQAAVTTFRAHTRETEGNINARLARKDFFLWADTDARRARLRTGEVVCEPRVGKGDLDADGGLIHHWVGAVFVPGVAVDRLLELIQNYDNHKNTYKPEVIASTTLDKTGNDFRVYLRLLEKRFASNVVLDTRYEVRYMPLAGGDWASASRSTEIVEIANAGTALERRKADRESHGYLWFLNSYWLFRNRDGGTYVECEAVSLSRGIPAFAKWMSFLIRPFVRTLPRDFLERTLNSTRNLALEVKPQAGR